jgi:membrane-bound lytic murein transglycosylase B
MIHVKNLICAAALALLCASCNSITTASISESRAEAPIRQACPAFRSGIFTSAAARTYGAEQITTFQNGSNFQCRCIVKSADQAPVCNQVRPFSASLLKEG